MRLPFDDVARMVGADRGRARRAGSPRRRRWRRSLPRRSRRGWSATGWSRSRRRRRRSSGRCANAFPRRTARSARSRRTTSRCRCRRIPDFIARGDAAARGAGRVPDELLRACGRRQPALQRLPDAGPEPRRSRGPAGRDQAGAARPRARDGRLGQRRARHRAAQGRPIWSVTAIRPSWPRCARSRTRSIRRGS